LPAPADSEKLAPKRYVTVILRLLLERRGQLVHGELVDLQGKAHGRFGTWQGLPRVIRVWLASEAEDNTLDQSW
jgi:hypothetical protein